MKPLNYTYRGNPLIPQKGPSVRRRKSFRGPWLLIVCLLLLALAVWGSIRMFRSDGKPAAKPEQAPARQEIAKKVPEKPAPTEVKQVKEKDKINPEAETLENARAAYQEGRLEDCRNLLRPLLMTTSPENPKYNEAARLLGNASMALFATGKESSGFIEHKVTRGENLSRIARKYNTQISAIQRLNGMGERDTALRIGQKLKVPKNVWSIRIDRAKKRIFLKSDGKLFAVYPFAEGTGIPDDLAGEFTVQSKKKKPIWVENGKQHEYNTRRNVLGARWLGLRPKQGSEEPFGIHGTNLPGGNLAAEDKAIPGYFRMTNNDVTELYDLILEDTPVEIVGVH